MATISAARVETKVDWLPLVVICLAQMMIPFNSSVINMAIGPIVADLETTPDTVRMALVVYALVTASLMILAGKLGAIIGRTTALRLGLGIFACGAVVAGLAPAPAVLIAGEAVSGLGAAVLVPSFLGVLAVAYQGKRQAMAIGALSASAGVGGSLGLLLGGWIINSFGWSTGFFAVTGVGCLALALSLRLRGGDRPTERPAVDLVGALLAGLGIFLIVFGAGQIGTWGLILATPTAPFALFGLSPVVALLVGGGLLLQGFFAWQQHRVQGGEAPLLSPVVLDSPLKRGATVASILATMAFAGVSFTVPLYTQIVQGMSPLASAIVVLPFALGVFGGALLTARLSARVPARRLGWAMAAGAIGGMLALALAFSNQWDNLLLMLILALVGVCSGVLQALLSTTLVAASPPELGSEVGALRGTASNLGQALGPALIGAVLLAALVNAAGDLVRSDPLLRPEVRSQVTVSQLIFVSDTQLAASLAQIDALTPGERDELLALNAQARLNALRAALIFAAGILLLDLFPLSYLPRTVRQPKAAPK